MPVGSILENTVKNMKSLNGFFPETAGPFFHHFSCGSFCQKDIEGSNACSRLNEMATTPIYGEMQIYLTHTFDETCNK